MIFSKGSYQIGANTFLIFIFSDPGTDNRLEVREAGAVHAHHFQGEGPAPHRDSGAAGEETEEGAGGEDSQLLTQEETEEGAGRGEDSQLVRQEETEEEAGGEVSQLVRQ